MVVASGVDALLAEIRPEWQAKSRANAAQHRISRLVKRRPHGFISDLCYSAAPVDLSLTNDAERASISGRFKFCIDGVFTRAGDIQQ